MEKLAGFSREQGYGKFTIVWKRRVVYTLSRIDGLSMTADTVGIQALKCIGLVTCGAIQAPMALFEGKKLCSI